MVFKRFFEICRTGQTKKVLEIIRNVSFIAIIFVMAFVGIYFILGVDLALDYDHWIMQELNENKADQFLAVSKSKSLCLMIAVLLTFGSATLCGVSEMRKDKLWLVYSLKTLAIVLAVVFILFVGSFEANYLVTTFFTDPTEAMYVQEVATIKTISIILTWLGMAGIATNIVSNVLLGIEE